MKKFIVLIIFILALNAGCNDGTNNGLNPSISSEFGQLTIIDKGAVVPEPVVDTLAIYADKTIRFKSERISDFGDGEVLETIEQWTNAISDGAFNELATIVKEADIANHASVGGGDPPCPGPRGITISFTSSLGHEHSFEIEGGSAYMCGDRTGFPELEKLLNKATNLREKYEPDGTMTDYASDATECQPVEGVTVAMSEEAGSITENTGFAAAGDGSEVELYAVQVGSFTTRIGISSRPKGRLGFSVQSILSFTLKQVGEKEFDLCGVLYGYEVGSLGSANGTVKGEIVVDRFNDGATEDMSNAINAGSFAFEFAPSIIDVTKTAVSVMKHLAGGEGKATKIEGAYFIEGLTVPAEEPAK